MASSSGTGTSDPTSPPSGSGPGIKVTDGWDNEEWGSLEEEPVSSRLQGMPDFIFSLVLRKQKLR